jgi:hypothetical protein
MLRLADPAMIQNQRSAGSPWLQICWQGEQREIEARGARASNCRERPAIAWRILGLMESSKPQWPTPWRATAFETSTHGTSSTGQLALAIA